jgi:hypothetical protein
MKNSPYNVAHLTEDYCGVEPVTLPPVDKETRPPPIIDEEKLRSYDGVSAGFLGSKFFFHRNLFLLQFTTMNFLHKQKY